MPTVYTAEAYSFASRFVLREVRALFPPGATMRPSKTQLLVEWGPDSVVYAYDFGALVFIHVAADVREATLAAFARALPREPHPPLREELLIELHEGGAIEVAAAFDRVVVPDLGPVTLAVIAYVLAQSVSIDYYDEDAQAILDRIGAICTEVAAKGRPRGRQRDLVRFIGAALASQVEIISAISLLDKPDITWEDQAADRLHDRLRYALEIHERHSALEAKLLTIRESLQTLIDLAASRRTLFLEIAVVILIFIELIVGFVRVH